MEDNNIVGCRIAEEGSTPIGQTSNEEQVKFHRHCQATVLSAYGPDGNGLTWNLINDLDQKNKIKTFPTDWIETYFHNQSNITQDLAGILQLIDKMFDQLTHTLKLKYCGHKDYYETITFDSKNASKDIDLGRNIQLSVNDNTIKFNTVRRPLDNKPLGNIDAEDTYEITLPTASLTRNGVEKGQVVATGTKNTTISIDQDYCGLPCVNLANNTTSIKPTHNNHIFRVTITDNKTFTFDLSSYKESAKIVQWELHIKNTSDASKSVTFSASGYGIVALTDQLSIPKDTWGIYVFRADINDSANKSLVYSLAYRR